MGSGENGLIEIGVIVRAHGVQGAVKALSYSGHPERFQSMRSLYVSSETRPGEWKKIRKVRSGSDYAILCLEDVNTREEAKNLTGCVLRMRRKDLPDLPHGIYYISDLIGFDATTSEKGRIGFLKDVQILPAQDVLIIETEKGEIMIPMKKEFVRKINDSKREIRIEPIDGLLDLNAD